MFPGFVTAYKDNNQYIHLYFFPGLDDHNRPIFREMDLKNIKFKYEQRKNLDNSVDYKFYNKNIIRLNCKLLDLNGEEIQKIIEI